MLRDGETVGVVDIVPGVEEQIVELMLGARIEKARASRTSPTATRSQSGTTPRLGVRNLRVGTKLQDVSFDLHNGEVLGVVALEGQGQDELFGALVRLDPAVRRHHRGRRPGRSSSRIPPTPSRRASPMCRATGPRRC